MRCASYATADGYELIRISDYLNTLGNVVEKFSPEIIHAKMDLESDGATCDIFIFEYGCLIIWGASLAQEKLILKKLSKFTRTPFNKPYDDACEYVIKDVEQTTIDEENDLITLGKDADISMISISYGLSQSIKLAQFEDSVIKTIAVTKKIPRELIELGKISLSRKELAQKMGELFAVRNLINLYSDLLDTPEFFWRRPKCEPYYMMTVEFLDIKTRIEILNKRLDVLHELYEMLSNELQHIHGSRLEIIIIFLITFEVILSIFRDILGWL
jgi:uncharacterized Rmd1/YagE family protein